MKNNIILIIISGILITLIMNYMHNHKQDHKIINVPYSIEIEENEQKSVDEGHSPWRLDPIYVAQVFASLKIMPEGIEGKYPIKYKDLKIIKNEGDELIIEINEKKSIVKKVYVKRLIRQDPTGIWTVVGYEI